MQSLLQELKRRRVLQTAAVYVAAAWAATEMLGFLLPALNFPRWTVTIVAILFVLGFPVAMLLAWVFDVDGDGIRRTVPGSAKGKLAISVALTFLIVSTAGLFYLIYPDGPEAETQAAVTEFNPPDNSIAVLPFVNMSDDPENVYFSDGVAEEVLHKLAGNPNLWVTARTSSFKYRDDSLDVRTIGEQLNVAKILEGSVRKAGSTVRITVQLINTRDGYHDWSETFDRELTDIFAIQDEIANSVGDELVLKMAVASRGLPIESLGTDFGDMATYDLYLRGRYQLEQGTQEGLVAGIEALERVVATEPGFAQAWLGLARSYAAHDGEDATRDDRILEAATNAVQADPFLGPAYAATGRVYERRWQWIEAEQVFKQALASSPADAFVLGSYGTFLAKVGYVERAEELLSAAVQRDPLSAQYHADLAAIMAVRDDFELARKHAERARQLGADTWRNDSVVIQALLHQGDFGDARQLAGEARKRHGEWFWPDVLLDAIEDPSTSSRVASELKAMEQAGGLSVANLADYLGRLGEMDGAYTSAWKALENHTLHLSALWSPEFVGFRSDDRFEELILTSGMSELWKVTGFPDSCESDGGAVRCD
jgi:TolB-like protein/Tfp pilus assembly protein PilF